MEILVTGQAGLSLELRIMIDMFFVSGLVDAMAIGTLQLCVLTLKLVFGVAVVIELDLMLPRIQ